MTTHKMVPREPTDDMGRVSAMVHKCACGRRITQWAVNKWPEMVDAAPAVQDAPPPREPTTEMLVAGWRGPAFWSERSTTPYMERAADLWRTMHDAWYAAPAVADAPRTAATPGDPVNVIRPEGGGLSEYTTTQEDAPPPETTEKRMSPAVYGPDSYMGNLVRGKAAAPQEDAPLPSDDDLPGMLAVAKGVAEQRWPHTMDAKVWTDEFCKRLHIIDRDLAKPAMNNKEAWGVMIGWFANAIMAGFDTARMRDSAALAEKDAEIARYRRALDSIADESQPWRAAVDRDLIFRTAAVAIGSVSSEKGSTHADD